MSINPTFGINYYNKPKVQTELETVVNDILMILYGKPGFYPSIPTLGMDVRQYLYQQEEDVDTNSIKNILAAQCADFIPYINSEELDVVKTTYRNQLMLIFVLPTISDTNDKEAALSVTLNPKGELIYKFVENLYQSI